ncbi:MAG: glycoside hydrolase family 2 TIM barrel-domain containing protein [Saprospiraceae bacterium]
MKNTTLKLAILLVTFLPIALFAQNIPLPEHPRPDFERVDWQNLNGSWDFALDAEDQGVQQKWQEGAVAFKQKIMVPFPWGSALSGVKDEADIGWYKRTITVDPSWKGKRAFLTIGASDWETSVWLDGHLLGTHQGGYVPFSFDLTPFVSYGQAQQLVIRADDKRRDFTLYGKQGYGNARGIWQTVYLEARGATYLEAIHFTPDIDAQKVKLTAYLSAPAVKEMTLSVSIQTAGKPILEKIMVPVGKDKIHLDVAIPQPHLWSLEDPYLYEAAVTLGDDLVKSYFGMRKIAVNNLPGTDYLYISLNDKPIYLQLALDQSYHPDGFYTFPSDDFMREEIERSKSIGLNGIRPHIKVEIPRKLYWADKLGLLVMADLPNSWGDPEEAMQEEAETTLRKMIKRDYNHPSIFSWILFNETWGLRTHLEEDGKKIAEYQERTQMWVSSMYYLAKSLDPTRLVEDNSICCGAGHTETDINSFHEYLPGWAWEDYLKNLTEQSHPGSNFHFEAGFQQGNQPKINSECGNVWGYQGSTGDVDWSWDYHRMINTFRKYPEVAGWLYTEHHDVINEWNGYWRFDRTEKFTGMESIMTGMSLKDLHAPVYLSTGNEICQTVRGGEEVQVPLYLSVMTDVALGDQIKMTYQLELTNALGLTSQITQGTMPIDYQPYLQKTLAPLSIKMPEEKGLAVLKLQLEDKNGQVLHHNFMHFEILSDQLPAKTTLLSVAPKGFSKAAWTVKQWDVLDGLKVNGAGQGFFEYTIDLPATIKPGGIKTAYFLVELSAKTQFVKDLDEKESQNVDFMLGGKASPSGNPNAYPMTDETLFPSDITVSIDGKTALSTNLADDPADHRGVLSWHHQLQDKLLREAGSYGYLVKVPVSKQALKAALKTGKMVVKIAANGTGGVAVYGASFGRYPLDPSLVLVWR